MSFAGSASVSCNPPIASPGIVASVVSVFLDVTMLVEGVVLVLLVNEKVGTASAADNPGISPNIAAAGRGHSVSVIYCLLLTRGQHN